MIRLTLSMLLHSFLLLCVPLLQAQSVVVDSNFENASIVPDVFRDAERRCTMDSFLGPNGKDQFVSAGTPYVTFGADPSNWWLRFSVQNLDTTSRLVILRLNRKNFDAFHLWTLGPDGAVTDRESVGADYHSQPRFFLLNGYYFSLQIPPGQTTFYGCAVNRIGSMHLSMNLESAEHFTVNNRVSVMLFGLFLGVILVAIVFSLLFYQQLRDPVYLFYLAYVLNILCREAYNYSADFSLAPEVQRNVTSLLIATTFGLFFRQFLRLWELAPLMDRMVKTYASAIAVLGLIILPLVHARQGDILKVIFMVTDFTNLFFTLLALLVTLYFWRTSERARITAIAYLPLALGFVAILLRNMNIIPNFPFINHAVMVGFIIEVLVLTIGFSIAFRVTAKEKEHLILQLTLEQQEKQLAIQTAEQQVKDRIARDLHDDVAASMASIRILSQVVRKKLNGQLLEVMPLLEQIGQSAQSSLDGISDIIWAVKTNPDFLNDLADRMRDYAGKTLEVREINYHFDIPRQLPMLNLPVDARRNLYFIFKETINNAAKYSRCKQLNVTMKLAEPTKLLLRMEDDGCGFNPNDIKFGNGLLNIQKRAKDLGADLHLSAAPGKGVLVQLTLNINAYAP
jgi:signal transduction histidine kinase